MVLAPSLGPLLEVYRSNLASKVDVYLSGFAKTEGFNVYLSGSGLEVYLSDLVV